MEKSKFEEALAVNVNDKTEKKGNLTYLSWSWAWSEFKKIYPEAIYNIKKFGEKQLPYIYDEVTGYMVFTEVTAGGITHEMWLPVMDFKNQAMKTPSMFDINKTMMRCLTKNLAMFGLGLYIYSGEDLPEDETVKKQSTPIAKTTYTPNTTYRKPLTPVTPAKPINPPIDPKKAKIVTLCKETGMTGIDYKKYVLDKTSVELEEKNFDFIIGALEEIKAIN